jgi:hypothetical protein
VLLGFALNEMLVGLAPPSGRAEVGAELVRGWMAGLPPGGRIYIVEPGTKETSRTLQGIRERLVKEARVLAPCTHADPCPLLRTERDWCHLTWPAELGPCARRLADMAQRRFQETHFSWLVLEKALPGESPRTIGRVLSLRATDKHKLRADVCSAGEILPLVALRRASAAQALEGLGPGAVVEVDRSELTTKGDGLRLGPEGLRRLREL